MILLAFIRVGDEVTGIKVDTTMEHQKLLFTLKRWSWASQNCFRVFGGMHLEVVFALSFKWEVLIFLVYRERRVILCSNFLYRFTEIHVFVYGVGSYFSYVRLVF